MENKITFVIGAGSTSFLGMPMTKKHSDIFNDNFKTGNEFKKKVYKVINELFRGNYTINDIYNIIDSNIALGIGLDEIENNKLREAKKEIEKLIIETFEDKISNRDDKKYEKLVDFYYELARYQLDFKYNCSLNTEEKDFFVSNYSIINFNWDLYSTMPIVEANKKLNDENNYYLPIKSNPKIKIFTDLNCEYVSVFNNSDSGYSVTESVARCVNKESYAAKRKIVLMKAFYPHGLQNLFKCESCAKHSMYLGKYDINSVIEGFKNNGNDLYKCPYCHSTIKKDNFDILIQSNFKVRNSYLEEIRINMMAELRKSNIVFFIGYSVPSDDIENITLFKSLNNVKKVYVVLYKEHMPNRFINSFSINTSVFDDYEKETFNRYVDIFKDKEVFFNYSGFPDAMDEVLKVYKNSLE